MSTIRRVLPETHDEFIEALHLAKNKLDSILPANNPLSANTTTRLNNMVALFDTKAQDISTAAFAYNGNTPLKESAQQTCFLFVSHFIQVFNLGVKRNVYAAAQRDFFDLPVSSDVLPDLVKGVDIMLWANKIVNGDPLRVAAGGAAMSNPTDAEVHTALSAFVAAFTAQSNFKDALDIAQEALEALLPEAEKVVRKVWDELETFYNEESDESRRDNCREWGVVYMTMGSDKTLSGTVTYNGAAGVDLEVRFKSGKNKSIVSATGAYSLNTTLMGTQKIVINKLNENNEAVKTWTFDVVLNEDGDKQQNFTVND